MILIIGAVYLPGVPSFIGLVYISAGGGLIVQSWRDWEFGIKALLVVVVVEGAVRKWMLPAYSESVYFYKDALMVACVLGYLGRRGRVPFLVKGHVKTFTAALGAFVLFAAAVVINPSAPNLLASLVGVKAYCLYMPLVYLVPRMFTTREKLVAFLRWYLLIAIPVVVLGAWQFLNGPDAAINRYAVEASAAARDMALFVDSAGNYYVRITGTFSFVSGLAVYLPLMFALLLGLTSLRSLRSLPLGVKWLYYVIMGGVAAAAFMTGSRGVVVNLVVVTVAFYAFTPMRDAVRRLRQLAVGVVLVYLALTVVAPRAVDALYMRALGGDEQIEEGWSRIADVFQFPTEEAAYAGAFGYGIGATQNSVPALMSRLGLSFTGEPIPIPVENESGRIMLELGIVGYTLYGLLRLSVLSMLLSVCLKASTRESKALAAAVFAGLLFPLIAGGAVVNHTQNVYQWFLVGVSVAILNADMLARQSAVAEERRAAFVPQLLDARARVGTR